MSNYSDDTVSHASVEFFEKVMSGHSKVRDFDKLGHREYAIHRTYDDTIRVWLTGKYIFGILDYHELHREERQVNCIVASSAWNKYTRDAKDIAVQDSVGLFTVKELLGALNLRKFWKYQPKD